MPWSESSFYSLNGVLPLKFKTSKLKSEIKTEKAIFMNNVEFTTF